MNVLKKEGESAKYTVIKLYREGARPVSASSRARVPRLRSSGALLFPPKAPSARGIEGRDRRRDTAAARASQGRRRGRVVRLRQFWRTLAGARWAHGHDDETASAAPAVAVTADEEGELKLPTKAGRARVLALPAVPRHVAVGEARRRRREESDGRRAALPADEPRRQAQRRPGRRDGAAGGRRGVAGDIDDAAFVKNFAREGGRSSGREKGVDGQGSNTNRYAACTSRTARGVAPAAQQARRDELSPHASPGRLRQRTVRPHSGGSVERRWQRAGRASSPPGSTYWQATRGVPAAAVVAPCASLIRSTSSLDSRPSEAPLATASAAIVARSVESSMARLAHHRDGDDQGTDADPMSTNTEPRQSMLGGQRSMSCRMPSREISTSSPRGPPPSTRNCPAAAARPRRPDEADSEPRNGGRVSPSTSQSDGRRTPRTRPQARAGSDESSPASHRPAYAPSSRARRRRPRAGRARRCCCTSGRSSGRRRRAAGRGRRDDVRRQRGARGRASRSPSSSGCSPARRRWARSTTRRSRRCRRQPRRTRTGRGWADGAVAARDCTARSLAAPRRREWRNRRNHRLASCAARGAPCQCRRYRRARRSQSRRRRRTCGRRLQEIRARAFTKSLCARCVEHAERAVEQLRARCAVRSQHLRPSQR